MELEVIRSNRKTIGAEIRQNKLIIRAPFRATNEDINAFLLKNKTWIETHLAKAQERQKELGVDSDGYIFSVDGEYCSYYAISDLYRKYCDKLGIALKSSHKSRKTFISILLDANVNANTVRERVGHADERTTLQSYHYDRCTEDERIRKMEEALNSARI